MTRARTGSGIRALGRSALLFVLLPVSARLVRLAARIGRLTLRLAAPPRQKLAADADAAELAAKAAAAQVPK
ncbi:MAG: hypothetical protein ACRYG8_51715 [Janthinobacterium lividum]